MMVPTGKLVEPCGGSWFRYGVQALDKNVSFAGPASTVRDWVLGAEGTVTSDVVVNFDNFDCGAK